MLSRDGVPPVEVGVALLVPYLLTRLVVASALPAWQVAVTILHGPYMGLEAAHGAVLDWCAARGRRLACPRWEVCGPHSDDPAEG